MEATKIQDCSLIVKAFQKKMMSGATEAEVFGGLMPSVGMMQVNAVSAAGNLNNAISPPLPTGLIDLLAAAAEAGPRVELSADIPTAGNQLAALGLEWIERCIPCNLRLKFKADLVNSLSDTLLRTLQDMLNNYLKELAFILNILNSADVYQDACLMLMALNDICIPDIQRMISLLSALLYRHTAKSIMEGVDIMKLLILPIFQPIFTNLAQLFGQYRGLITDPLQCVIANLGFQLKKIKTGGFLTDPQINSIENRTDELQKITGINGVSSTAIDFNSEQIKKALKNAQSIGNSYDDGIDAIQNSLGTAVFHLRRLVMTGIVEVETILADLEAELIKFLGGTRKESINFLLQQYDRLLIIRMLSFLSAVVQAMAGGFSCNIPNEEAANVTLAKFFTQFLGPQSGVLVTVDPRTNRVLLTYDTRAQNSLQLAEQSLSSLEANVANGFAPVIIEATGNDEIDQTLNAIMTQASTPVTIKPKCFFETQSPNDNKLMQYLAELDAIEV
jgi:hypothetical protein